MDGLADGQFSQQAAVESPGEVVGRPVEDRPVGPDEAPPPRPGKNCGDQPPTSVSDNPATTELAGVNEDERTRFKPRSLTTPLKSSGVISSRFSSNIAERLESGTRKTPCPVKCQPSYFPLASDARSSINVAATRSRLGGIGWPGRVRTPLRWSPSERRKLGALSWQDLRRVSRGSYQDFPTSAPNHLTADSSRPLVADLRATQVLVACNSDAHRQITYAPLNAKAAPIEWMCKRPFVEMCSEIPNGLNGVHVLMPGRLVPCGEEVENSKLRASEISDRLLGLS